MRHENYTNKRVRSVSIIVAIVMFVTMLTAVITQGFTDFNPYGWFKEKEETKLPETSDNLQFGYDNTGLVTTTVRLLAPSEYEVYYITGTPQSVYHVTASITPYNATFKDLDWKLSWKNSTSSFANGKTVTDFVKVTPSQDTLTATVECKEDFGEQVILTISGVYYPEVKAEVTIDYVKKIYGVESIGNEQVVTEDGYNVIYSISERLDYESAPLQYKFTNYTIDSEVNNASMRIVFENEFIDWARSMRELSEFVLTAPDGYEIHSVGNLMYNLLDYERKDEWNMQAIESAFQQYCIDHDTESSIGVIYVSAETDGGVLGEEDSYNIDVFISSEMIPTALTGIMTSVTSITF